MDGVFIEDSPRFSYCGLHLDVGRHFFSVDFVKRYIDALARLKLNVFHWHLTEDQIVLHRLHPREPTAISEDWLYRVTAGG